MLSNEGENELHEISGDGENRLYEISGEEYEMDMKGHAKQCMTLNLKVNG